MLKLIYFRKDKTLVDVCCFSYLSVFTLEKVSIVSCSLCRWQVINIYIYIFFFGGGSTLSSTCHIFYTCSDDDDYLTDTHFLNHNVLKILDSTTKYLQVFKSNKYIVKNLSIK